MKRAMNLRNALLVVMLQICLNADASVAFLAAVVCPTIIATPVQTTICTGQTITLNASGAVNYTWTKSPGGPAPQYTSVIVVSPTTSTLYKVVGDDGQGCKDSVEVAVVVNPLPAVTAVSNKTLVCVGAPSTLTAGGGHTYQWSSNAGGVQTNTVVVTPSVSTVYQVTVTNNSTGCSASKSIQVNVFDPIISLVGTGTACVGSPLSFTVNGSPAQNTSYSFTPLPGPGYTALPGTTHYTLSINKWSAGNYVNCYDSDTVSVTGLPTPTIGLTGFPTTLCINESATLTASGGLSYTWNVPGTGNMVTVNAANNTIYSVTGSGTNACVSSATLALGVLPCTGVDEILNNKDDIRLSPNPNNGLFKLETATLTEIRILNTIGQEVIKLVVDNGGSNVIKHDLPEGVYFVVGRNGKSLAITKMIIVRQ